MKPMSLSLFLYAAYSSMMAGVGFCSAHQEQEKEFQSTGTATLVDVKERKESSFSAYQEQKRILSTSDDYYYIAEFSSTDPECPHGEEIPSEECALAGFFVGRILTEDDWFPDRIFMREYDWAHTPVGCFSLGGRTINYSTGDGSSLLSTGFRRVCKRPDKVDPRTISNSHFVRVELQNENTHECNASPTQQAITDPQDCAFGGLFLGAKLKTFVAPLDKHSNTNIAQRSLIMHSDDTMPKGCFLFEDTDGNKYIHHNTGAGMTFTNRSDKDKFTLICSDSTQELPSLNLANLLGSGGGDPHFETFNGQSFSFHGQCDLVMTKSEKLGLDLHIRTTRVDDPKNMMSYSYISGAAMRIDSDVLEVKDDGSMTINGERVLAPDLGDDDNLAIYTLAGYPIKKSRKGTSKKIVVYRVILEQNDHRYIEIRVNTKNGLIFVDVAGNLSTDSVGLLGTPGNHALLARDGKTDLTGFWNAYGEEWQVVKGEPKLFEDQDRLPQHPLGCMYEARQQKSPVRSRLRGLSEQRRHLMEENLKYEEENSPVTFHAAERACVRATTGKKRQFCIDDVMATNDLDLAEDSFYN